MGVLSCSDVTSAAAAGTLLPRWGESRLRSQSLPSDPALDQLAAQLGPTRLATGSSSLDAAPPALPTLPPTLPSTPAAAQPDCNDQPAEPQGAALLRAPAQLRAPADGRRSAAAVQGRGSGDRGSLRASGSSRRGSSGSLKGSAGLAPPVPVAGARPRSGPCGPPQRGQSGPTVVSHMCCAAPVGKRE